MEKERDIYYGIALCYCIAIVTDLLVSLSVDIIGFVTSAEYMILMPICNLIIYVLVLYIVFWRFKSYPDIKLWFFILLLIVQYLPRFTYILSPADEHFLSKVSSYTDTISVIYTFSFAYFAYKLNKQARQLRGVDEELNPQYIYYGMVLIPLITPLLEIVSTGILSLCRYATLPVALVYMLAALSFILFITFFFVILKKKFMIRGLYLFIIPLAAILVNRLETHYDNQIACDESVYIITYWLQVFTVLTIFFISFIRYYQLDRFDNSSPKARLKQWVYCIVITLILLAGNIALAQVTYEKYEEIRFEQNPVENTEEL